MPTPLNIVGGGSLATCPRPHCRWERVLHPGDSARTKQVQKMWTEHLSHHADPAAYVESVHAKLTPEALEVGGVDLPNVHSLVGALDLERQHWQDVAVRLATYSAAVTDKDGNAIKDSVGIVATIREEMIAAGVFKASDQVVPPRPKKKAAAKES